MVGNLNAKYKAMNKFLEMKIEMKIELKYMQRDLSMFKAIHKENEPTGT